MCPADVMQQFYTVACSCVSESLKHSCSLQTNLIYYYCLFFPIIDHVAHKLLYLNRSGNRITDIYVVP